jgi:hypothetical protein
MFSRAAGFDRVATIRRKALFDARTGGALVEADEDPRRQAGLTAALDEEGDERGLDGAGEARMDFLCECLDPACREVISITLDECDFVRRVPSRLVVKVGHADEESERVLMEEPGRFQVVERFGSSDDVVAHIAAWGPRAKRPRGQAA